MINGLTMILVIYPTKSPKHKSVIYPCAGILKSCIQ